MANTIVHKRNGTASSVPTTGQLTDGEIAINYNDGRMFFRRNVSGTYSIREVATLDGTQTLTNKTLTTPTINGATMTGPVYLTGDLYLTSGSVVIGSGGNWSAGAVYADANWGMLFRAKTSSPGSALFGWADSAGNVKSSMDTSGGMSLGGGLTIVDTLSTSRDDNPAFAYTGRAGHYRYSRYYSGSSVRWDVGLDSASESGSSVGSNYYWSRWSDGGAATTTMVMQRSTGYICLGPAATLPSYAFEVADSVNAATWQRNYNGSTGSSASVGQIFDLSGVSNAYVQSFLHKNSGSPYWRFALGSAVTEGFYFDGAAMTFRDQAVTKNVFQINAGSTPSISVWGNTGGDSLRVYPTYGSSKFLTVKPETSTNVTQLGYWTGSSFGTMHLVGTMKYTCATWHLSDEGVGRLYYVSSGSTIYESGGTGDHQFRNSSDANIVHFDTYGNLIFDAAGTSIYMKNNTGLYAKDSGGTNRNILLYDSSNNMHVNPAAYGLTFLNYNSPNGVYIGGGGTYNTSLIMNSGGLIYFNGSTSTDVGLRKNGSGKIEVVLGDQSDYGDFTARAATFGGAVKGKRFEFVNGVTTLGTSGTVTPTWTDNNYFRCTTSGNVTLAIGTAPPPGTYIVEVVYGGSHTLTVPSHNGSTIRWAGGAPPASTNTSGKIDIIQIVSDGTNVRMSMSLNY